MWNHGDQLDGECNKRFCQKVSLYIGRSKMFLLREQVKTTQLREKPFIHTSFFTTTNEWRSQHSSKKSSNLESVITTILMLSERGEIVCFVSTTTSIIIFITCCWIMAVSSALTTRHVNLLTIKGNKGYFLFFINKKLGFHWTIALFIAK